MGKGSPYQYDFIITNYVSNDPISKKGHILRDWRTLISLLGEHDSTCNTIQTSDIVRRFPLCPVLWLLTLYTCSAKNPLLSAKWFLARRMASTALALWPVPAPQKHMWDVLLGTQVVACCWFSDSRVAASWWGPGLLRPYDSLLLACPCCTGLTRLGSSLVPSIHSAFLSTAPLNLASLILLHVSYKTNPSKPTITSKLSPFFFFAM